jgi:hypothetical protein
MGMDLAPRKPVEGLHLNWSGWRATLECLGMLGCDLSKASGMNDGQYIDGKTCKTWGKALRTAVESGTLMSSGKDDNDFVPCFKSILAKPIGKEYKEWLLRTATFFETCGGCWQY